MASSASPIFYTHHSSAIAAILARRLLPSLACCYVSVSLIRSVHRCAAVPLRAAAAAAGGLQFILRPFLRAS